MAHTIDEIRKLRNGRGTSAASSSDSKTRSTGHSVDEIRRLGGRSVYEDSEGYKPTQRADLNVSAPSKPTSDAYRYGTPSGNATLDQLNTMMSNFNKIQTVLSNPKNMPDFKSDAELKDYYESIPDYNVFERLGDSEKTEKYNQKQALSSKYNEIKKANDLATLNAYGITEDELRKAQENLQGAQGGVFNKEYMSNRASDEEMQKIYDKFDRVKEETGINPYELQFDYQTEIDEKLANEHPISSTISTYAANPVESTLNTGKKVINYATGKPIENDYSYTNNVRNTVSQNIDSEIGRQAYGIGNSIVDMGVALLASRLTGSTMVGAGLQGFEKADAVMNESINRGLNPTQIMMEGIASGITTAATESIPMGKWEEIAEKKLVGLGKEAIKKNVVKKLLAGMASEGLQEMSEDVADLLVDKLIAGDKSEIDTNIRTLMEMNPGMTKEEAEAQAWKDWCVQVVLDGVGGAISGGVMSGLSIGVGLANPYATGYINREALSEQIKKMDPESEVYKTYQDLAQKRGETLSSASDDEVSDLFQKAYAEASKADRTAYDKVISDKLKEAGYTDEQVKATLEALTAKNPTKRQKFLIDNELVRDAVNEADNTEGLKMVQKVAENVEAIDKTIKSAQEVKEEKRIAEAESKINTDTESSVRGDKVEIYGMDIKGGVYVVNTSKGSFPVEDVKIASDIQDAVTHSVNISDDNLKEAFVKNYHGQDISAYEAYAYRAFMAGKSFNQNLIDENTIDFLGSEAVHDFLDAGRLSVRKQTKESEERAIQAASEAKGKFKQGTFTNNVDYSKLDSTRKRIFNFLKGMANIGGLHINVINDINDQNGMFQYDPNGGTITVNLAAGATDANGNNTQLASYVIPTLSHEMTHYLEANAPSAYNALEKAVLKALRAEGFDIDAEVSKKIDAYKKATNGKVILSESEALDEIIAQSCEGMMSNEETMEKTLSFMNMKEVKTFKKALEKFFNAIKGFIKSLVGSDAQMNRYALAINNNIDDIQDAWAKALALALERQQILNGESNTDVGVQIDDNTDTAAFSIRTTLLETYQDLKFKSYDKAVEYTAISIANQLTEKDMSITKDNYKKAFKLMESDAEYKEMYEKALKWVKSEESIATFIAKDDNKDFLDYIPDERYQAIKQNSDYAQGTFDLSNLCRKRELFTLIFDNLQIANPDILFTAEDIALIRDVMVNAKEEVACALCYVEDRRQLMGEIADTFINMYKDALKSKNKVIIKTTSEGEKKPLSVTKEQSEKYGYDYKSSYKATDSYIPNQADLITYKGFKNLTKEHPTIAHAFENYNNSRGMQAGRLVEGHAEYKREVLNYTKSQVESKNNKGGLRIFSFSDLEGIHVIDLMQLLIDCASKGVYAQAYTKVPAFARIVKDTGVKLNRSLIPANKNSKNAYAFIDGKWTNVVGKIKEDGIATVNGKEYLAVDTVEGIDVTSKDFINDPSNPNIGNIIIGISDKQIKLALDDPNVDYVIPFHTGQSEKILHIKGIDVWDNYKDIQEDKGDGEKINIYTDVIDKYNVTNKKEFVDSFKEECAKRGLTPRFDKFKGETGYYKLLLDYKLFDENGNILPQGKITPAFDTETLEYIKSFLLADKERSKNLKLSDETMNKIYEEFDKMGKHLNPVGEETRQRYSIREDSEGNKLTEDQAEFFKNSKAVDEDGRLEVMYHGTPEADFTVFDPSKSDDEISFFFTNNREVAAGYSGTDSIDIVDPYNLRKKNPTLKDLQNRFKDTDWRVRKDGNDIVIENIEDPDDVLEVVREKDVESAYKEWISSYSWHQEEGEFGGLYPVYLNSVNPLVIDAQGDTWDAISPFELVTDDTEIYDKILVLEDDEKNNKVKVEWRLSGGRGGNTENITREEFKEKFGEDLYKKVFKEKLHLFTKIFLDSNKKVLPTNTRELARYAYDNGYDSLILENIFDIGPYSQADVESKVIVVFNSNQIKATNNLHPTANEDIRYSIREDSDGNKLTEEQAEFFKDSKIVDKNGNLKVEYHGTNSDFFVFDTDNFGGVNGRAEGYGIYFTDDQEITSAYGGRQLKGYVNITKPAYSTKKTIKSADLVKLIKTLCENEAKQFVENGDYDSVADAIKDTWVSNYEYTYDKSMNEVYKLVADSILRLNSSDMDIIQEVMNGTSIYSYKEANEFYSVLKDTLGFDRFVTYWTPADGSKKSEIVVAFDSNQFKLADNVAPTENNDIRYSVRETDPNLITEDRKEKIKTLKEDIALLKERANLDKQESKGQFWKPETLDAVAKYVIDETKTTVARKELREDLSALYNTIAYSVTQEDGAAPNSSEAYERIMNNCYKLASKIYEASPMKVKVDANVDPLAKQTIGKIKEQDAIQDLAVKIYNKYWSVKRLQTVADKYQKKVDALEKEHKKNMTIMLKKQGLADEIFYKDIINKVKKEAAEEKANYKEKNKQKAEAQKEANERRAEIEKITDQAKTLSKWLFQNSKNHPIPDPLKTPLLKMLAAIDPSSKQLLGLNNNSEKAFTPTKKDESMSLILGEVAEALKNINQQVSESEKQYGNKESGLGFLDVPQYMIAKLDKIAKDMHRLEYKYDTLGKKVLELMDLESLQELRNDISMIKTAISTVNYAISQGNKIRVNYVAQYIIQYLKDLGQAKRDSLGNFARPIDFLTLDNTTPYYFFKHLGEGGEIVFNILADGMDKMTDRVQQISEFTGGKYNEKTKKFEGGLYTEEEQKKWRNNIREFELTQKLTETEKSEGKSNKVKVKLTDAQIMSLYCLAKREINGEFQGLDHMLRDGITIGQIDGKKKIGRQDTVTITKSQLDKITDIVENDKRMKEVADGLVKFMSTTLSDWGNEVTWARWGIKQFVEDHYFPIAVNKETTKTDNLDKSSSLFALLNQDFTKPLQKEVRNEIMVYDIFDVFTKHASDMARYSSLGLPILDTIKVWNYSESEMKGDVNEERNKKNAAKESGERYDEQRKVDSVKKSIAKAFGEKGGNRYISNLLKNLNGQADKGVYDNIGMGMMKRYKASKIAASTMTALVQPLSYLRAGYVISPKYMLEALTKAPQIEKMFNNVPVAKWKRMSLGVDTNIGRGVDRIINHQNTFGDKIVDKSLWLAEKMDELTWGYIYNAVEAEVKATRKDLKPRTKEFDQEVAKRAREVIYSTQIFDSTLTRSSFMRDKGYHAQMLSAFMSEPTLSYNMLLDSVTQYYQDAKKNGSAHALKNKGKVVAKAISVYTLSAVVESVIREAFTRLRDYQDDDEEFFEDFWKDVIDRLKDELNILNKIPYAKQLMDAIEAFGKAYQNNNKMDEAFIQDIGKSIKAIDKAIESEEISYNTVYTVLNALADVTGLPFGNALREVKMIWNNTIGRVTGKYIQK